MEPVIEIATPRETLTLTGTDVWEGQWIYNNETLDSWLSPAEVDVELNRRPNAHGTYFPDQLFMAEHRVTITGQFFGRNALDATRARNRWTGLYNDGKPVMVTVVDALGGTSRTGIVIDVDVVWSPDYHFTFSLVLASPDPRRYSDLTELETGLATASTGLVWPLGSSGGLFWNWGTPGNSGRLTMTNEGNTSTYPTLYVGDGGSLPDGFRITEVETGRELAYSATTNSSVIRLDNRTRRATIGGGDVSGVLTRREWFEVPAGATYSYQFATLGAVVGNPKMRLLAADAYL